MFEIVHNEMLEKSKIQVVCPFAYKYIKIAGIFIKTAREYVNMELLQHSDCIFQNSI